MFWTAVPEFTKGAEEIYEKSQCSLYLGQNLNQESQE
jgi:hypothetical protein